MATRPIGCRITRGQFLLAVPRTVPPHSLPISIDCGVCESGGVLVGLRFIQGAARVRCIDLGHCFKSAFTPSEIKGTSVR